MQVSVFGGVWEQGELPMQEEEGSIWYMHLEQLGFIFLLSEVTKSGYKFCIIVGV
jgi:hypothetical protein